MKANSSCEDQKEIPNDQENLCSDSVVVIKSTKFAGRNVLHSFDIFFKSAFYV